MAVNLRAHAKGHTCTICGNGVDTVVLHHIRVGQNGGMGKKPPDTHGISVCAECHSYLHGEGITDYKTMLIAHLRQVDRWIAAGVFNG